MSFKFSLVPLGLFLSMALIPWSKALAHPGHELADSTLAWLHSLGMGHTTELASMLAGLVLALLFVRYLFKRR